MNIKATIVPFTQGSEEWAAHRARSLNASDLAAAMGLSQYLTRADLVARLATGVSPEIDAATQRRFDRGHEVEALARPLAEEIIGEELYAMVYSAEVDGIDRPLSASLDGCTLGNELTWEHKQANAELVSSLKAGVIPYQYHPQMEQGLMLTGAERCLFTASNGTAETAVHVWYESNPELREKIIPTWKQLLVDVANYVPPEPAAVVVAEQVQALPAVMLNVSGQITVKDNFKVFETAVRDFLEHRLIRKPETDQDFADLDAQIKMLKAAEEALDASEAQMLAQISEVDTAKKAKDMLHDMVRKNRLMAEKLLEAEKQRRREEIVRGGVQALSDHIASLDARLGAVYMQRPVADFAGAIKGKRNLDSMQDAVNTLLANCKIEANALADRITANLKAIEQANAPTLFADKATLVLKQADDLAAIIANRLAAEQQRQEAERERIRQEEAAKLAREAEAKAQAEAARIKAEAEELARQDHAKRAQAVAAIKFPQPELRSPEPAASLPEPAHIAAVEHKPKPAAVMLEPTDIQRMRTLKDDSNDPWAGCTGLITTAVLSARLGIESLRAAEIESLGFTPVKQSKPGTYWHEHQTQAIGFALAERIRKNVTTAEQKAA